MNGTDNPTCVACGRRLADGEFYIRDRDVREVCFPCIGDAIIDLAIEKQRSKRQWAELKKHVPFLNVPPFADEREE